MKRSSIWLLLLLVPLYGFWVFPTQELLDKEQIKVEKLEEKRDEKTQELLELQELRDKLKKLQEENKNAGMEPLRKLPFSIDQEDLIQDLQEIANRSGFKFNAVGFSTGINKDLGLPEITMNFSVEGLKAQVPKFLQNIEENERFLLMDDLGVSVDKQTQQTVSMQISLHAFAQEELKK